MNTIVSIALVTSGSIKSCGKCNLILAKDWINKKFGKLRMLNPIDIHKYSNKHVEWICDCGSVSLRSVTDVIRGHSKSCGKCDIKLSDFWKESKFGKLRMLNPGSIGLRSNKKVEWICDCGNITSAIIQNVTRGRTTACGKCRESIQKWYFENQNEITRLKPPISQSDLPNSPFVMLESVTRTKKPFSVVCPACKRTYKPNWDSIRLGKSLTCGCVTYRISNGQKGIHEFLVSNGVSSILEYKIGKLNYDICIPDSKLVIEFNGLKYHSLVLSKHRDFNKYKNAIDNGFSYMMVFEDEWSRSQNKIKSIILNRLLINKSITLRASSCLVKKIPSSVADEFYEENHYIGGCRTSRNYGAFFDGVLVGCISFKKPTRQSKYEYELIRMSCKLGYRINGLMSKLFKVSISDMKPLSIVSFSDNRLFTGKVYEKLGFTKDGELNQDYYWVKGGARYHKSGLRKKSSELNLQLTEKQLRESQGYKQIWDVGKTRWVMHLTGTV
jgi:predicted SprT family Zn-dependent metalloprotease